MKIIVSWDHAGLEAAKALIQSLKEAGHEIAEFGSKEYYKTDDYPDFVIPAMKNLLKDPDAVAVVLCKNGVGVSMLANKFKGIRAALSFNADHAASARADDNANVLAIPTHYLSDAEILDIVQAFLETSFSGLERHVRRLKKVTMEEEENFKT